MSDPAEWYAAQVPALAEELKAWFRYMASIVDDEEVVGMGLLVNAGEHVFSQTVNVAARLRDQRDWWMANTDVGEEAAILTARWNPNEWCFIDTAFVQQFDDAPPLRTQDFCREAARRRRRLRRDGTELFEDCLAQAMATLFREGFFARWPSVQVMAYFDDDLDPALGVRWMAAMNTPEAAEEYARFRTLGL